MELEQHYLKEVLQSISNPQSESYEQILTAMFAHPTPDHVEVTFDTDVAAKAHRSYIGMTRDSSEDRKQASLPEKSLLAAINSLGVAHGSDIVGVCSAMNATSVAAAISALRRAREVGKLGQSCRDESLRGAPQRSAVALAMNAAASAAITGNSDGVHGADPRVTENVCMRLKAIFEEHGAVHLRAPLLRPRLPRHQNLEYGAGSPAVVPAEVMNRRGAVLILPDDLTANFARAVARGGDASSHLKRYDIDKVFHEALTGGHPRESLEASFDIVFEDPHVSGEFLAAEALMVICEVMATFATSPGRERVSGVHSWSERSPFWYLRLTNTRLADSILDFCGVPPKEAARKACLRILTRFTACPPKTAVLQKSCLTGSTKADTVDSTGHLTFQKSQKGGGAGEIDRSFEIAVKNHGLPIAAAHRLRTFLAHGCLPLPANAEEALDRLSDATRRLRMLDIQNNDVGPKRSKRYEEIGKGIRSLRNLFAAIHALMIGPTLQRASDQSNSLHLCEDSRCCPPAYISVDLGLRQRRKHIHGHIFFQAVMLPGSYFTMPSSDQDQLDDNDTLLSSVKGAVRVAEGGRYDDLIRKFRPPGNFGSSLLNCYTSAAMPMAIGVVFHVGKLVERIYIDSRCHGERAGRFLVESSPASNTSVDILRAGLGHPLCGIVNCIVASVHGFDAASLGERAAVAARLWAAGISCEYIPQCYVVMGILGQHKDSGNRPGDMDSYLTLDQLCGVCAILKIPFIVIVQPHLLKDKDSVRLRTVHSDTAISEEFVALSTLASAIQQRLSVTSFTDEKRIIKNDADGGLAKELELTSRSSTRDVNALSNKVSSLPAKVHCIYVDSDQYYGEGKMTQLTSKSRAPMKALKTSRQRAQSYLSGLVDGSLSHGKEGTPVVAVDVPFRVLREFGTVLMLNEGRMLDARNEVTKTYPKYKKNLKTLSMAVESLSRRKVSVESGRKGIFDDGGNAKSLRSVLLYSTIDDRFDLLTLRDSETSFRDGDQGRDKLGNDHGAAGTSGKRDRSCKR